MQVEDKNNLVAGGRYLKALALRMFAGAPSQSRSIYQVVGWLGPRLVATGAAVCQVTRHHCVRVALLLLV